MPGTSRVSGFIRFCTFRYFVASWLSLIGKTPALKLFLSVRSQTPDTWLTKVLINISKQTLASILSTAGSWHTLLPTLSSSAGTGLGSLSPSSSGPYITQPF